MHVCIMTVMEIERGPEPMKPAHESEALSVLRAYGRALRSGDEEAVRHVRVAVDLAALRLCREPASPPQAEQTAAARNPHLVKTLEHLQRAQESLAHIPRRKVVGANG